MFRHKVYDYHPTTYHDLRKRRQKRLFAVMAFCTVMIGVIFGIYHAHTMNASVHMKRPKTVKTAKIVDVQNPRIKQLQADASLKQKHGFINQIGYPAVKAYQRKANYQVLPSIVIAQAIIESDWGQSNLYTEAHNIFGVKGSYHGKSALMKTEEYSGDHPYYTKAYFRKYPSLEASILDHDQLLRNIFIRKNRVMDYRLDARLIKKHDYATDPQYADKLIRVIRMYHLYRYDEIGLK